jgi:hypothetical protein
MSSLPKIVIKPRVALAQEDPEETEVAEDGDEQDYDPVNEDSDSKKTKLKRARGRGSLSIVRLKIAISPHSVLFRAPCDLEQEVVYGDALVVPVR